MIISCFIIFEEMINLIFLQNVSLKHSAVNKTAIIFRKETRMCYQKLDEYKRFLEHTACGFQEGLI